MVRLGAMGDILHALPAVTALRAAHPDWQIDWVLESRWKALLTSSNSDAQIRGPQQPLVDHVYFTQTKAWGKRLLSRQTAREIGVLRSDLRDAKYDAVIDLQGAIRSAFIGRAAKGKRFLGEDQPREQAARWLFSERVKTIGAHVIQQDIELVSALAGDQLVPMPPLLPVDPAAEAWCDGFLAPHAGQPIAILNPGAGWGAKRWPVECYTAVAQSLIQRGMLVVVNAGPGEEPLARAIEAGTGGAAVPLVAPLEKLIALTRRIALFVAGDTGPLHLACALGRPVVGIYGPTDPTRNGPFGSNAVVLRSPFGRRVAVKEKRP